MTRALGVAAPPIADPVSQAVLRLLASGGDERIRPAAETGANAYGCLQAPWTGGPTFASSTASPLSPEGFAAARAFLAAAKGGPEAREAAAGEIRRRLLSLCALAPDTGVILAPSGTDLHLIAAALARGEDLAPLTTVMPDAVESGRGVEKALRGEAYATHPPFGPARGAEGAPGRVLSVTLRHADASPAPAAEIDAACAEACERAIRAGGPVLLVLLDVSKTGLCVPSLACAAELKARHGERLSVLVDACQFRLPRSRLATYLARDFLVAVTGSKFLGGPAFSGALLMSPAMQARLSGQGLAWRSLSCSARQDWPAAFAGRALLPQGADLGLAVRWAAALGELDELTGVDRRTLAAPAARFAQALQDRLARSPVLRALPGAAATHDGQLATIFSMTLERSGQPLPAGQVAWAHRRMLQLAHARRAGRFWLGQPVTVGRTAEGSLDALRLSLNARHMVWLAADPRACDTLVGHVDEALGALERIVLDG